MKRWLLLCVLLFTTYGCSFRSCSDDPACTRILFIGNSYTYVNDLPGTFTKLADSGGQRVETGMAAQGGWTLAQHVNSSDTLHQIISQKWKYVVLQEQSEIPASQQARTAQMYPAARALVSDIRQVGATPILFITWAHRDGWPEDGIPTYENMQQFINGGYVNLGQELQVPMAPVGYAWFSVRQENPQMSLWQDDGSHPTVQGTYLAACVFYAVIFQKSPEGLSYTDGLSKADAQSLQKAAADTVLSNAASWNLP